MNPDVPELSDKSSSVPDNFTPTFQNYEIIFDFLRDHSNILISSSSSRKSFGNVICGRNLKRFA